LDFLGKIFMKIFKSAPFIAVLVLMTIVAGVWAYQTWHKPDDSQRYRTQTLSRGDLSQSVTATGTLNPVRVVSVGTQVSGIVKKLYVDFNDEVKQGQILLELDPDLLNAKLQQSQASLNSAKAKLSLAQSKTQRLRGLFKQGYLSQQELDEAETDLAANLAQYAQIQAQVQSDKVNLENTIIRSPVSGVVINREIDEGQTVAASFQTPTLIKIAQDLSKMQINANFSEADLGKLKEGQAATFRVDAFAQRQFDGQIRQIRLNPTTQQNVVTYDVVINVDNPDLALLPGMTAYVDIILEQRNEALLLPNAALRFKPEVSNDKNTAANNDKNKPRKGTGENRGMAKVYILEQGKPKEIKVKVGISNGKFTEVLSNELKEGNTVIVNDSQAKNAKNDNAMRRL
jgi:HlyD family secretion protein